jgi:hypothetical protein
VESLKKKNTPDKRKIKRLVIKNPQQKKQKFVSSAKEQEFELSNTRYILW